MTVRRFKIDKRERMTLAVHKSKKIKQNIGCVQRAMGSKTKCFFFFSSSQHLAHVFFPLSLLDNNKRKNIEINLRGLRVVKCQRILVVK